MAAEYHAAYYADENDPRIAAWASAHEAVWNAIVDQILLLHPTATSLLDVGAGGGGLLARLHARRPDLALAAVEPAAPARAALTRRFPGICFPADSAEQLEAVDARFDVVMMLQTLEHVHDPLVACRGAWHCLRPGGLLMVTVPNRRSLAVLRHGRAADCYANGTHLQFFARTTLHALLRRAGFDRVRRRVDFGGGQHSKWLPQLAQYALRAAGWSSELRYVACKA
ncbi:MAG TPA: class I SAM-dependent methyltransferase [Planctomycetota bacterium]|nr:class I SAM-dependent methyltransferase [Planctomycetota bacterium]